MEALVIPIFRWSGLYIGFLSSAGFFDVNGLYLGWKDDQGKVWNRDGTYFGELVEEHYILRRSGFTVPVPRPPRVPPVNPELPTAPANRIPRSPMPGWMDALEQVGLRPRQDDLIGLWQSRDDRILLREDLVYHLSSSTGGTERGTWMLRTNLMLTPEPIGKERPANLVFQIIEYSAQALTLRRLTFAERSLPFTLGRSESGDW